MTNYAYLRVSTDAQDVKNQKLGVMEYANARGLVPIEIVEDTASGKLDWRKREVGVLLEKAVKGDVILVAEVSRLARSTIQVLELMRMAAQKEVSVHVAKNSMVMDGSMAAKITVTVLALAGEIEREFISERTKEGLARRKAEGKVLGRPKGAKSKKLKLDAHQADIKKWQKLGLSKTAIAKLAGVSRTTLDVWVKRKMEKEALDER
jgi:DNA invertase Pin-like site-specific DNA recombinase